MITCLVGATPSRRRRRHQGQIRRRITMVDRVSRRLVEVTLPRSRPGSLTHIRSGIELNRSCRFSGGSSDSESYALAKSDRSPDHQVGVKSERGPMFHNGIDSFCGFSNMCKPVGSFEPPAASEGYAFANAKSEPNDHPGMPFSSAKLDGSFNPPETSWSYAPANVKDGTKELIDRTPRDFQGSKGHI